MEHREKKREREREREREIVRKEEGNIQIKWKNNAKRWKMRR